MKILEKLEEKFSGVELKKSELEEKFFEENKIFFETERALNTNKNQEIISIGKKIKEKISNLFGDNEELQFDDKVSEFENKFQVNFSEYFDENGEILEGNFSEENKAENLELFRESKKIRSNIEGFNETAFLSEDDDEFKIINGIYNKLADFNVAFIDAYSNKKEEIESKNKREDSEKPVLGNNGNEEFESGKKSGETYGKINKLIAEKEKFDKVKDRKKSIIDETFTFNKLNKSEVEDFGVDIEKQPGAFNIMKNTRSAVGKLILAGSLVFGGYSGLNYIKNNNTESSGNDKNKTSRIIDNNNSNISLVDSNSTGEITVKTIKHAIELANDIEDFSKEYLEKSLSKEFLNGLTDNYGINILKELKIKDSSDKDNLTEKDIENLKKLQVAYFKNPDTANGKNFGKNSLKGLKIYLGYKENKTGILKPKPKPIPVEGNKLLELEKKFNTRFGIFFDESGKFIQNKFDKHYENGLKNIPLNIKFFREELNKFKKDEKLKPKVNILLNILNKKIEAEKPETKFHDIW